MVFSLSSLAKGREFGRVHRSPVFLNSEPCSNVPSATLDPKTLLAKLNATLLDVDKAVAAALVQDKSPGGAVLSLLYKDTVLWSNGYGLRNMSGTLSLLIIA